MIYVRYNVFHSVRGTAVSQSRPKYLVIFFLLLGLNSEAFFGNNKEFILENLNNLNQ